MEHSRVIVCLGEALVDVIPAPSGRAARLRPQAFFGGALGNVAVAAARAGAPVALAGGTGTDRYGDFLRSTLEAEGVDTRFLHRISGMTTPYAEVTVGPDGEPSYSIQGDGIEAGLDPLRGSEVKLIETAEALVIGSNTLVREPGRSVTLAAVAAAGTAGIPVLFDPNLRPGRWARLEDALELCRELAPRCTLVKLNLAEARLLAGEPALGVEEAAEAVYGLGCSLAIVTSGAGPATARGADQASCSPRRVSDPRPIGAGDAFMGTLTAELRTQRWELRPISGPLTAAAVAGAEACRTRGAIN